MLPCLIAHPVMLTLSCSFCHVHYRHGILCLHTWRQFICYAVQPNLVHTGVPRAEERLCVGPAPQLHHCPSTTAAAAAANLENMLKYALEEADIPKCASNALYVDAYVQMSRPLLPNPFVGVEILGIFSALINPRRIFPVYKVEVSSLPQRHPLLPPPLYPDSLR